MTASTMVAVKTVVVADDTAFVRDRFATALAGAGHRSVGLKTWPELMTLVRIQAGRLDLIALDLRLPNGIGTGMVRALRAAVANAPPIVVFSGTIADAVEVRDLTTLGVAGYLNEYTAVQHIVPALAPHLFPEHYQRRLSPRVGLAIPVAYRIGNTIVSAITVNISPRGLAIRTADPLAIGATLRVRFRLSTSRTDVESDAHVVWSEPGRDMGIEFSVLDAASQTAIDAFVDGHFFSNRKG
jgi:CheY-like chemotaxis protein